jgi:hypothetical protein
MSQPNLLSGKRAGYLHVVQPPFDLGVPVRDDLVLAAEVVSIARAVRNFCVRSTSALDTEHVTLVVV